MLSFFDTPDDYRRLFPYHQAAGSADLIDPISSDSLSEFERQCLYSLKKYVTDSCSLLGKIIHFKISKPRVIEAITLAIPLSALSIIAFINPTVAYYLSGYWLGFHLAMLGEFGLYYSIAGSSFLTFILSLYIVTEAISSLGNVPKHAIQFVLNLFDLEPLRRYGTPAQKVWFYAKNVSEPIYMIGRKLLYLFLGALAALVMVIITKNSGDGALPKWLEAVFEFSPKLLLALVFISNIPGNYEGMEKILLAPRPYIQWLLNLIKFPFQIIMAAWNKWLAYSAKIDPKRVRADLFAAQVQKFERQAERLKYQELRNWRAAKGEINYQLSRGATGAEILDLLVRVKLAYGANSDRDTFQIGTQNPTNAMNLLLKVASFGHVNPVSESRIWRVPQTTMLNALLQTLMIFLSMNTNYGFYMVTCLGIAKKAEEWLGLSGYLLSCAKYLLGTLVYSPLLLFYGLHVGSWLGEIAYDLISKTMDAMSYTRQYAKLKTFIPVFFSDWFHRLRPASMIGTKSMIAMLLIWIAAILLAPPSSFGVLQLNETLRDPDVSPNWIVTVASFVLVKWFLHIVGAIVPMLINIAPINSIFGDLFIGSLILRFGSDENGVNNAVTRRRLLNYIDSQVGLIEGMDNVTYTERLLGMKAMCRQEAMTNGNEINVNPLADNSDREDLDEDAGKVKTHLLCATLFGTENVAELVGSEYRDDSERDGSAYYHALRKMEAPLKVCKQHRDRIADRTTFIQRFFGLCGGVGEIDPDAENATAMVAMKFKYYG